MYLRSILIFKNTSYVYGTFFSASLIVCVPPVLCQIVEGKGEWPCFSEFSRFSCAGLLYPLWWDNSEYLDVTPMLTVNISDLCVGMELDILSLYNNVPILEVFLYVALV